MDVSRTKLRSLLSSALPKKKIQKIQVGKSQKQRDKKKDGYVKIYAGRRWKKATGIIWTQKKDACK